MPKPIYTEIVLPEMVRNAVALATKLGFSLMPEGRPVGYHGPPSACIPQVGRLLQVLTSSKPGGRIVMRSSEPYDLLFMDATPRADLAYANWDAVTELVSIGGQIVMDDMTPVALWPTNWDSTLDYKREFAFANPRVVGTEVLTTPTTAALIVTRIR